MFEENGQIQGYAMAAKSFSTEFGRPCIWVEDLYIKEDFRGTGIGSLFLEFIEKKYPEAVLRLEVEEENGRAVKVYEKNGFNVLPYMEMKNCYNQRSPRRILQYLLHSFLPAFQV